MDPDPEGPITCGPGSETLVVPPVDRQNLSFEPSSTAGHKRLNTSHETFEYATVGGVLKDILFIC